MQATIAQVPCDLVVVATPIDLRRIVEIPQPSVRVGYELEEIGEPTLKQLVEQFLATRS